MSIEQQFSTPELEREDLEDLLLLSEKEIEELKARVEKWDGLIRIFVHPMYEKWWGKKNNENKKLGKIIEVVAKLSSMEEEDTPPIIIMEEYDYINKLKNWLEHEIKDEFGLETNNKMYVIGTKIDSSDPEIPGSTMTVSESWEQVRKLLEKIGVKKILIGGMQLTFSENERGTYYHRCLGGAITQLSKDANGYFEIELSNLSYPEGREEWRGLKDKKPRI
ncbi:MAG: hypothetical protein WC629_01925 [Candidatus Paceibacterota bacterium]|jgi:hypothetical protein